MPNATARFARRAPRGPVFLKFSTFDLLVALTLIGIGIGMFVMPLADKYRLFAVLAGVGTVGAGIGAPFHRKALGAVLAVFGLFGLIAILVFLVLTFGKF